MITYSLLQPQLGDYYGTIYKGGLIVPGVVLIAAIVVVTYLIRSRKK